MKWTKQDNKLVGSNGETWDLIDHEFWYVAPTCTTHTMDGQRTRPLDFAFILHNAAEGEGIICGLDQLLEGIAQKTLKGGAAAEAEYLLEAIRQEQFPDRPSRLRSYFLNYNKQVAENRAKNMFRQTRKIVRCYSILASSRYHYGDIDLYERLEGRPDDRALAQKYWEHFNPQNESEINRLEVLADSCLYFPDWQEFPKLTKDSFNQ